MPQKNNGKNIKGFGGYEITKTSGESANSYHAKRVNNKTGEALNISAIAYNRPGGYQIEVIKTSQKIVERLPERTSADDLEKRCLKHLEKAMKSKTNFYC